MKYLLFTFVIAPALEIALLLLSGKTIGILPTVLLILLTGFVGAYLAKRQGMHTFIRLRQDIESGRFIGDTAFDGVCVLFGGLLLLTPGFVTDAIGFVLLIPYTRTILKPLLIKVLKNSFQNPNIIIMK